MYITPDLNNYECKEHSQFGEDGILECIATNLSIENGTYFEIGISPGSMEATTLEGNFVRLREKGWKGVFLDGGENLTQYGVRREFITALNINELYIKHGLNDDLDFMSIDIDGQEFWVWMNLQFRPKLLILEINGGLGEDVSKTIAFDVHHMWDGTIYHGCSYKALKKLAESKGYVVVWCNGVNVVCIRGDLISNEKDFLHRKIFRPYPPHKPDHLSRSWIDI